MRCEAEARAASNEGSDDEFTYEDPFIAEGLQSESSESEENTAPVSEVRSGAGRIRLQVAKARRESLKRKLFRAKDEDMRQRRRDRATLF